MSFALRQTAAPQPKGTRYAAPFTLMAPAGEPAPLVFASPHSGRQYPSSLLKDLCVPLIDLRRTEDAFIDELFAPVVQFGAWLVAANYARSFVDLNRDARELDPAMFTDGPPRACGLPGARVQAGLGCLPKVGAGGRAIYGRRLSTREGERRLADVHDVYHAELAGRIASLREDHGVAFLVDCHSMPSVQPGRRRLADIVLGDRFGSSCCSRFVSLAERQFRRMGYTVARNAPYAGGYTTRRYGRPKRGVNALQIEIRRDLYMDEFAIARTAQFETLQRDLMVVCQELAEAARDAS